MKRSIQAVLAVVAASFSVACLSQPVAANPQSLRGTDAAADDKVFEERNWRGKMPGSQKPIARTYSTQPPLIPHAIENLDEVTLEGNQCLSCHGLDTYKQIGAPRLGDRHFAGNDPKSGKVAGARHACVMCHVPQVDAKPLVENAFKGDRIVRPAAAKKR
jgi:cytochrome c-type protein NapB